MKIILGDNLKRLLGMPVPKQPWQKPATPQPPQNKEDKK
jgi:hypothetical protein